MILVGHKIFPWRDPIFFTTVSLFMLQLDTFLFIFFCCLYYDGVAFPFQLGFLFVSFCTYTALLRLLFSSFQPPMPDLSISLRECTSPRIT